MRYCGRSICCIAVVAACFAFFPNARADAFTIRHLYVAVDQGFSSSPEVLRFPLRAGHITHTADLTYSQVGAPVAIGPDGSLYAGTGVGSSESNGSISEFPPGSNKVQRTFNASLPSMDYTAVSALAVDAHGYIAVGSFSFFSTSSGPSFNFSVFAPGAQGNQQALSIEAAAGYVSGTAFDTAGRLLVAEQNTYGYNNAVRVWANPETATPKYVGSIAGGPFHERDTSLGGIAVDASDELYAFTLEPSMHGPVSAFPAKRLGLQKPDRTVAPVAGNHTTAAVQIAVDATDLYVPYYFSKNSKQHQAGVFELDKFANGTVRIVDALVLNSESDVAAVAVGP